MRFRRPCVPLRRVARSQYAGVVRIALVVDLGEIGEQTQIATRALAARYSQLWAFVAGSPPGMLLAKLPAVRIGRSAGARMTEAERRATHHYSVSSSDRSAFGIDITTCPDCDGPLRWSTALDRELIAQQSA